MLLENIEDLPPGPLEKYRNGTKFDWKKMKMILEFNPECFSLKMNMWKTLLEDPIFSNTKNDATSEEMKKIAAKRLHRFLQYNFFPPNAFELSHKNRLRLMIAINEGLAIAFPDVSIKYAIGIQIVKNNLATLGTERHKHFLDAMWRGKVVACVALTEIAHGSDTKNMKTTATFDVKTQEFVIQTPDFHAAKCWSGNLGKTATLTILFAQLVTNGQNFGLHAFVVPIRDPKTLLPYPGIIVGDMGLKIGLHGIDNGFIMFDKYRIPKDNLLNRTGDVTPEGDYESSFFEPGKILGAALENLSLARLGIMQGSVNNLIKSVTIAVRYAAVRRQFSDEKNEEIPIINYQLHQWRVFRYVAAATVLKIFVNTFSEDYLESVEKSSSDRLEHVNNMVSEIHSIISGAKPLITWMTRDGIQECREACGGHAYLKNAGFGELRSNHDPTVTYEGDNNVLQQQVGNWLLKQWNLVKNNQKTTSPFCTAKFLENPNMKKRIFNEFDDVKNPKFIEECYEWLITVLVEKISNEMENLQNDGYTRFAAKNFVQVYKSCIMSKAYGELNALRYFWKKIKDIQKNLQIMLNQLGLLYGLSCIDKHIEYFYQFGYCSGPAMSLKIKDAILEICADIKTDMVGMVDALAPPDCVLNSILGKSDGKFYDRLKTSFFEKSHMERPDWWKEVIISDSPDFTKIKSKL